MAVVVVESWRPTCKIDFLSANHVQCSSAVTLTSVCPPTRLFPLLWSDREPAWHRSAHLSRNAVNIAHFPVLVFLSVCLNVCVWVCVYKKWKRWNVVSEEKNDLALQPAEMRTIRWMCGVKVTERVVATFMPAFVRHCFDAVGWAAGRASGL